MSGVKISELSKWSIEEIGTTDTDEILLPVSIGSVTGAMRASTLIEILSTMAPEHYMSSITASVNELSTALNDLRVQVENYSTNTEAQITNLTNNIESQISSLQSSVDSSSSELNSKYNEIITDLETFKNAQTEANGNFAISLESITNSLNDIISHNEAQDTAINDLRLIHDLPPYDQVEPEEPEEPENPE